MIAITTNPKYKKLWQALEFKRVELVEGNVKVDLDWFLDGLHGTYNAEDPDDCPILHVTVQRRTAIVPNEVKDGRFVREHHKGLGWEDVEGGSQLTKLKVTDPKHDMTWAVQMILELVSEPVEAGSSIHSLGTILASADARGLTFRPRLRPQAPRRAQTTGT